ENNKGVIACGVKNSTSDLLIANCDEFIFYDDLVREQQQQKPRRAPRKKPPASQNPPGHAAPGQSTAGGQANAHPPGIAEPRDEEPREEVKDEDRRQEAFDLVLSTIDALVSTRDAEDKIWGSMVKQALKRRRPGFNESYYGFRSFNKLLEDAAARKLLSLERDDKSGGYLIHTNGEGP